MKRITDIQLIEDLIQIKQKLQKIPNKEEYNKYGKYHCETFCRRFGSWNKILKKLFQKTNIEFQGSLIVNCSQCEKRFKKQIGQIKSKNVFCSRSCAVTYNNLHKTTGIRRSKLEVWLEEQLPKLYPNLHPLFNNKTAINSELDIYFPSLKLAFELNGIFHYEPIYGQEKLSKIQNNDNRKFQACLEKGIELCIIDSSSFKHFKPQKAQKYLNLICEVINKKLNWVP